MRGNGCYWVLGVGHWLFAVGLEKLSNPQIFSIKGTLLLCCLNGGFWVLGVGCWVLSAWLRKLTNPHSIYMNDCLLAYCEVPTPKSQYPIPK